ncbi:MAG TPA: hypothetical protein VKU60_18960, partial [Chloroflexota bacterium]|nr:hypothetical protein [Chloroflexota bacterium]
MIFALAVVPLLVSCGQRPLLEVGVQRITVEPNADITHQAEDIPYSLGAPAHVTITLLQPDGQQLVLRDNDRAAESYALPFGGIVSVPNSNDRKVLKDGDYKIVFDAKTSGGQSVQQTVDAVVQNADPTPLDVTDISLSLPVFSPNGQGMRDVNGHPENEDQTTFNYSLSKQAHVSIYVVDADGNTTPVMAETDTKPGLQQ